MSHELALMFIDLDGFKAVNDTLGHDSGDDVLKEAARRLTGSIRIVDTAARIGGDEFMIVLEQIHGPDEVQMIGERLIRQLGAPYLVRGVAAPLSASMGVTMYPRDGGTAAQLRARADAAMHQAKRAGKNRLVFHQPALAKIASGPQNNM